MAEIRLPVPQLLEELALLVTGAGQGNGRAIARGVAATGAKVIVTDVRQDTAQVGRGRNTITRRKGVGLPTRRHRCVPRAPNSRKQVEGEVGPVNVVVNNAGIIIRETIDSPKAPENWRRVMDVNVNGIFNVVHAWLPALRADPRQHHQRGVDRFLRRCREHARLFAVERRREALHPGARPRPRI